MDISALTSSTSKGQKALLVLLVGISVLLVESRRPLVCDKDPLVGPSSVSSAAQKVTSKAQLHTSKTKVAPVVEKDAVVLLVHPSCLTSVLCQSRVTSTDKKCTSTWTLGLI